jgi:hypothetical protein
MIGQCLTLSRETPTPFLGVLAKRPFPGFYAFPFPGEGSNARLQKPDNDPVQTDRNPFEPAKAGFYAGST